MKTYNVILFMLLSLLSIQHINCASPEICEEDLVITRLKDHKNVAQFVQCKFEEAKEIQERAGATKQVKSFYASKQPGAPLKTETVELGAKLAYSTKWLAYISGLFAKQFTASQAKKKFSTDPAKVKKQIDHYLTLYKSEINMDEFETPQEGFKTFNEWFIRKLKNPEVLRPIDPSPDVIVSPADCKILIIPNIQKDTMVTIKEKDFSVTTLLAGDADLAQAYKDGTMMIFRLAPYDYHRYHFPIDCFVGPETKIEGKYHSVNPRAYVQGVKPLTVNKRSYEILQPGGPMDAYKDRKTVMVHVGATAVASIVNFFSQEKPYTVLHPKGSEMGYFEFGGSTLVMLFTKGSVIPNKQIVNNSLRGYETAVKVRESIARWKNKIL